ncbi:MAG: protein kinase [Planctomycetota bacterium]
MDAQNAMGSTEQPKVIIHILRGKAAHRSREMTGPTLLIGSGPWCDVQMRSPDVAGKHCLVSRSSNEVTARKLDPKHPLLHNGMSVEEALLRDGDTLTIGPFELSISIERQASSATPIAKEVPTDLKLSALARIVKQHPGAFTGPASGPASASDFTSHAPESKAAHFPATLDHAQNTDPPGSTTSSNDEEKGLLRQAHEELARAKAELADAERAIKERQEKLDEREAALQSERLAVADEQLAIDQKNKVFLEHKSRLARVRKRMMAHFRDKHDAVHSLASGTESHAADLAKKQRELEQEVAHWRRVGSELGQRQVEMKRKLDELECQQVDISERDAALRSREAKLLQDIENLRVKERALSQYQADLDERKGRIAREEERARGDIESAGGELARAQEIAAISQKRFEEVETKNRLLAQQEEHLREFAKRLEEQRLAQVERDRELASRAAVLEENEAAFRAQVQGLREERQELSIETNVLKEREQLLERRRQELERLDKENADEKLGLEKRAAELEEHARTIFERFELERQAIAAQKQELQHQSTLVLQEREQFESQKNQWVARAAEVQEATVEMAERESLLEARARRLETVERENEVERHRIRDQEQSLEAVKEDLHREREQLQQLIGDTNRMAESLQSESVRLQSQAEGLQDRQRELLERERRWCEEVKQRRGELEKLAEDVERKRGTLSSQALAHRRQIHKLREVGQKAIERRKQSWSLVEQLERRHHAYQERLEALQESQKRILESVLDYADQSAQREQEAIDWLETVRMKNQSLAELQRGVSSRVQEILASKIEMLAGAGGTKTDPAALERKQSQVRALESAIAEWSDRLMDFQKTLAEQEHLINRREDEAESSKRELADLLQMVEQLSVAPRPPAKLRLVTPEADTSASEPQEPESPVTLPRPIALAVEQSISDQELGNRAVAAGLMSLETLRGALQSANHRRVPLAVELVMAQKLTRYQLACLYEGRIDDLKVGPATILDVVHEGTVSTIYRALTPKHPEPVAIRMYASRWCRDPMMQTSLELAIRPLSAFRHPHVVSTHEVLADGDRRGVVAEYVDGVSLADLALFSCPPRAVVRFCQQAISAVMAARRAGFTHHNLRPSRILVTRNGSVKISGYGEPLWLSKIHRCESGRAYAIYVAPEELRAGLPIDVRSDLYSLGQIFLELASGGMPRLNGDDLLPAGYPVGFSQLLARLIAENPEDRCNSVDDLDEAMRRIVADPTMDGEPWPELPMVFDQILDDQPATSQAAA